MVDYTQSDKLERISDDELINIIREGAGEYMPSWKEALDENEIVDVAAYVRRLSVMKGATEVSAQHRPNPLAGRNLYRTYCVVCHGADGKGKGPLAKKLDLVPADLSVERYQTKTAAELAAIIGGYVKKDASKMPGWGKVLPKPDLHDIAAYIPKIGHESLRFKGDPRSGRAVFKRACVACHGKYGTGKGVLAKLIKILMLDFTNSQDMKKMTDEELLTIILEGKGDFMPSWKNELGSDEIIDVASYVRRLAR